MNWCMFNYMYHAIVNMTRPTSFISIEYITPRSKYRRNMIKMITDTWRVDGLFLYSGSGRRYALGRWSPPSTLVSDILQVNGLYLADEHHLPDICHLSKYLFIPSNCHLSLIGIPSGDHLFVVCHLQQHPVQYTDTPISDMRHVDGVHQLLQSVKCDR
jgi:hypothetical protein